MHSRRLLTLVSGAAAFVAAIPIATAIGRETLIGQESAAVVQPQQATPFSAFTFQGRLTDGGKAANGVYDLRFVLYSAETGGTQVGQIITRDDVVVTDGIFTVQLDFGASAFGADRRWIEIAVKPGTSGTYSVLSPRQPVTPVPLALFAHTAGAIAVPATTTGTTSGADDLFAITQLGSGSAISALRGYEGAEASAAIDGVNAGGGAGVRGASNSLSGVGVEGVANGANGVGGAFTGKTAIRGTATTDGVALELDGPIKVVGTERTAFQHTVAANNTIDNGTVLVGTVADGDPNAMLFVTLSRPQQASLAASVAEAFAVAVVYIPDTPGAGFAGVPTQFWGKWAIFRVDGQEIPVGTRFNVLVVKQ